jgi:hypothetical protein
VEQHPNTINSPKEPMLEAMIDIKGRFWEAVSLALVALFSYRLSNLSYTERAPTVCAHAATSKYGLK